MQNSVKPMAYLFTFKLQTFRNNVNVLRENYGSYLTVVLFFNEKVN